MTVATVVAPPVRWPVVRRISWRLLLLVVATGLAFRPLFDVVELQLAHGDRLSYVLDAPVWAAVMAWGIQRRRGREFPIHDRHFDWIIATGTGVVIALVYTELAPRIHLYRAFTLIGVPVAVLFVFAGSIILFGSRPTFQFWPAWLFLLTCWPTVGRAFVLATGGTPHATAVVPISYGAAAAAIAAGHRWRPLAVAVVTALVVGGVVVSTAHPADATYLNAAAGALGSVAGAAAALAAGRWRRWTRPRVTRDLAYAKLSPVAAIILLGTGTGLTFAPTTAPPALLIVPAPIVAPGVPSSGVTDLGPWRHPGPNLTRVAPWLRPQSQSWAPDYYGVGASFTRYILVAPVVLHDGRTQYNIASVDVTRTTNLALLAVYPGLFDYVIPTASVASHLTLPVGTGVAATLNYMDDLQATSSTTPEWAMVSFVWRLRGAGRHYERVTITALNQSLSLSELKEDTSLLRPAAPLKSGAVTSVISSIIRGQPAVTGVVPPRAAVRNARDIALRLFGAQEWVQ